MNDNEPRTSRRRVITVLLAAVAASAAGGAAYVAGVFGTGYPSTPYDDVLAALPNRAAAIAFGKEVLVDQAGFDPKAAAAELRKRLKGRTLAQAMHADLSGDDLAEIHGWVVPATLAQISALAAKADA